MQATMTSNPTCIVSLFSGCGGMDLGFEQKGFMPIIAVDNDAAAVKSFNGNRLAKVAQLGDLSTLSGHDIIRAIEEQTPGARPRGVIGGPPCQSFSHSNVHGRPGDPRHQLPLHYASILQVLNKKYHLDFFVFENVVGLKSEKHRSHFRHILRALEDAGFNVFEQELNAKWFGVAQSRRRVFIVGINKDLYPVLDFQFPQGERSKFVTVKDAIGGLPKPAYYSRDLQTNSIPFHPNHWTMQPKSPKFKRTSEAQTKNGRSFRRLPWNEPSWTVAYGHREIHVHPNGTRRLSVFEAMRLQGFPDDYVLSGSFTQQVTQISNAVPPPLAGALAEAIQTVIYRPQQEITSKLADWFEQHQRQFPWRETSDPYVILVAEKLLQQTAAKEAVITAFERILNLYPTVESLAKADLENVKLIIAPLGFKYRANELITLARAITDYHNCQIPNDLNVLLKLPGIGDYSARAILCFGYGLSIPIVDTNVARFLRRVFGLSGSLSANPARSRLLINLASNLVPKTDPKKYNWAILDLCAEHCVSSTPKCGGCPLRKQCYYGSMTSVQ